MTQQSIFSPIEINNEAEGSMVGKENPEPRSPLRTALVPALGSAADQETQSSETGMTATVDVSAEGHDNAEAQDASLTTAETHSAPSSLKAMRNAKGEKPRALIIEDTMELAEVIQATLEGMDLEATFATHGIKGLELLKDIDPDVILLDIGLPDMIGWKILDAIKEVYADPAAGRTPNVVIITAYGDPANRLVAKLQGIHSYLIKPFTTDEVEKVVASVLSSAS